MSPTIDEIMAGLDEARSRLCKTGERLTALIQRVGNQVTPQNGQAILVSGLEAKCSYLEDMVAMYELEVGRLRAERDTLAARCRHYEQAEPLQVRIAN